MTQQDPVEEAPPQVIHGEQCPICHEKTLTLMEAERDIPYFGTCYLFSMSCSNCQYHKADVEVAERHGPVKQRFTITGEDDLSVRVIKSSTAKLKVGTIGTIEPGEAANGYITNIEGILKRIQHATELLKNAAQDEGDTATVKKAKNRLKKLTRVLWGQEPLTLTLTDPAGNSAIISEKTENLRK